MHPTLKFWLRFFMYAVVCFIILTALLLQGARLSAPHAEYFVHSIEAYAGKKTQADVTIGELDASWYGLTPHVVFRDISLAQQRHTNSRSLSSSPSSISIAYAEFKVDLLHSLFKWEWVWEKIAIQDVTLDVIQSENAAWSVAGFSLTDKNSSEWEYKNPISILRRMPDVDIKNVTVALTFSNNTRAKIDASTIKTETDSRQGFQRFITEIHLNDEPMLSIVLEDSVDVGLADERELYQRDVTYSAGYASVTQLPLHLLTEFTSPRFSDLPQFLQQGLQDESVSQASTLNGDFWFDFSDPKKINVQSTIKALIGFLPLQNSEKKLAVSLFMQGEFDHSGDSDFSFSDIVIDDNAKLFSNVVVRNEKSQSRLNIEQIDAAHISSWLQKRFFLSPKVKDVVGQLSPEGMFSNVQVVFDYSDISLSVFSANVAALSVQAFNNIPSVKNVNGYIEGSLLSGFINIDSQDMQLYPNVIYNQPFVFDEISGQVAWQVDNKANRLTVNSNSINAHAAFGRVVGAFLLTIPSGSDDQKSEFTLQLGLKDGDAKFHKILTPNKVPDDLRTWLDASLRKGRVEQAGFIYRGGFSGDNNTRSFQLFIDAAETDLAYSSDWPMLQNVTGQVFVDNEYVQVVTTKASMFNEPLNDLSIVWSGDDNEQLRIQTSASLSASSGLRLLTETKLKDGVGALFADVVATGYIETDINLLISPKKRSKSDKQVKDWQDIQISFLNNTAMIPIDSFSPLAVSSLRGALFYSSEEGLTSESLNMTLFDEQLSLDMETTPPLSGVSELVIDGKGQASIAELSSWLARPEAVFFSGQLPYQFTLVTPFSIDNTQFSKDSSVRLNATSSLKGVAVDLPEPFKKNHSLLRNMTLESIFSIGMAEHRVNLGSDITAELVITQESTLGSLAIGKKTLELPNSDNTFVVSADLNKVVVDDWIAFTGKLNSNKTDISAENNTSGFRVVYDLNVETLLVKDREFKDVSVIGERTDGLLRSQISHDLAAGELTIYDDPSRLTTLDLDYVRLPKKALNENGATVVSDPLVNVDLSWVKPTAISIKRLSYANSDFGRWRLLVDPSSKGIELKDIYATFSGMTLRGKTESEGAKLFWHTSDDAVDGQKTEFVGQLNGGPINVLFESLGVPPPLTSTETSINADFSWSGSPAAFSVSTMQGRLGVRLDDGAFIQDANVGGSGILRLLGLFNFNTWARRLKLDFSDFYKKGVAYDELSTRFVFDDGNIYFQQPLVVKAPSSEFTMAGTISYPNEYIDAVLVTTLPVGGNLTFATALIAGLPAAAGVFVFNKVFKSQVDKVSSLTYGVKGNWSKPEVNLINLFDNKLTQGEANKSSESPIFEDVVD